MTTRYSENYYATITSKDDPILVNLRKSVKTMNAANKKMGSSIRYRVRVAGRLGKYNPNASFYKNRKMVYDSNKYAWIRHSDAARFDVYLFQINV